MNIDKDRVKKILVIKFGGIGDVLLATPILPNLKNYFRNADIYFLTHSNCREIFIDNPYIKRYFTFNFGKDESWCLVRDIKEQKYDLIIDLFGNPRTAFVTFWSRAKYRVGFNFRHRKYAYNLVLKNPGNNVHNIEFNLEPLRGMNIPVLTFTPEFYTNKFHKKFADDFFLKNGIDKKETFGILISGGWETKKYKAKDFTELVKKIKEKFDVNILLIWGVQSEKEECDTIKKETGDYVFIAPETNLKYSSELMKRCKVVIGNDSGLLHLAVASEVPVLGIYGPTNPVSQGPYGEKNLVVRNEKLECLNCNLLECKIGNICMTELPKENIVEKISELIKLNYKD